MPVTTSMMTAPVSREPDAATRAIATRVAASRKGAAVRKAKALHVGAGFGPGGAARGKVKGDYSIAELLARIRAAS
jgi:hypothetical protein